MTFIERYGCLLGILWSLAVWIGAALLLWRYVR